MTIEPLLILGFSKASAYALYPLIGLYLLLPVYTVLGGWPRPGDRRQVRLLWLLILPTAAFVSLWICGRMICGLFLWLWAGERYLPYASWSSGVVALIVSTIVFIRMATGRASRRYLQVTSWGAGLCVGLFGAVYPLNIASNIDGWTARGAAENKFAFMTEGDKWYPAHLPRQIIDETTPFLAAHGGKAFALYVGDARVAEVHVMPYYRWWWTVSYFRNFPFGEGEVDIRKQVRRFEESLKNKRPRED